jgi:hypothetical protein
MKARHTKPTQVKQQIILSKSYGFSTGVANINIAKTTRNVTV